MLIVLFTVCALIGILFIQRAVAYLEKKAIENVEEIFGDRR